MMLGNFFAPTDDARIAWLTGLAAGERDEQRRLTEYREYYDGQHRTEISDRLKEFLIDTNADRIFRLNQCPVVIESVVERLNLSGFEEVGVSEVLDSSPIIDFAGRLWESQRLDAGQNEIYRQAAIDGETYLVADVDEAGEIVFHQNDRFTDATAGGDDQGIKLHYSSEKRRGQPMWATKRWITRDSRGMQTRHLTVYHPDRIERYIQGGKGANGRYREATWQPDIPTDGPMAGIWPQPWVDGAGQPLGIPIVPFRSGRHSDLHEVLPIQRALNKSFIDLIAAADMAGLGILFAAGWTPTSDGKPIALNSDGEVTSSNAPLGLEPGAIFYTTNPDGKLARIPGDDLSRLIQVVDSLILRIAQVSGTPLTNFQLFGQIPSAETQQSLDNRLIAKVESLQIVYGNAWEDAIYLARRLALGVPLFEGGRIVGHGLDAYRDVPLTGQSRLGALWAEAVIRNEREHLEALQMKRNLGVPEEQIFIEMGYTQDQARRFAAEWEARRLAERAMGLDVAGNMEVENG
jgi:hypothetical protein